MLYLLRDPQDSLAQHLREDPVRPHIPLAVRLGVNRDIFLSRDQDQVRAITCVSYAPSVPDSEVDLFSDAAPTVAVFYTIWSYAPGAGRALIMEAVGHIQNNRHDINRFVTLSPKTEMARNFHIRNGAIIFRENTQTVNYEYIMGD